MKAPKVSVVITTRNRAMLVPRAIKSALAQTYSPFDLHIVDDASEDETGQVVAPFMTKDSNVFYWRHEARKGLAGARNAGINSSNGEYVCFLDDDDAFTPWSLEKRIKLLSRISSQQLEKLGVIHGGWEDYFVHENRIAYRRPMIMDSILEYTRTHWLRPMSATSLYPRRVLETIGGFDESIRSSVEHDIWMTLAVHGYHAIAVDEPLAIAYYTRQKEGMCTDVKPRILGVEGFLSKWRPLYQLWYGPTGADWFIRRYRMQVFGKLCVQKLAAGRFGEAWQLARHLTVRNGLAHPQMAYLPLQTGRALLRQVIPLKVLMWASRRRNDERLVQGDI